MVPKLSNQMVEVSGGDGRGDGTDLQVTVEDEAVVMVVAVEEVDLAVEQCDGESDETGDAHISSRGVGAGCQLYRRCAAAAGRKRVIG